MEDEEFVGCISCMGTIDLCDLFGAYAANVETYATMLEKCFNIKVSSDHKYLCSECVEKLEKAIAFKDQTVNNMAMLQNIKDEEYLDESILEDEEMSSNQHKLERDSNNDDEENLEEEDQSSLTADDTVCSYCSVQLDSAAEARAHVRAKHERESRAGSALRDCPICGVALPDLADHLTKCHPVKTESTGREFPCHFCDNVYTNRKACFTHLRMKHGLKLYNDQTPKCQQRERKKCHLCTRDFSQKQILNKHLLKAHGIEVEKRKAFICPLCNERVSYGNNFSAHLLHRHRVHQHVEKLEFRNMDDFLVFKNAIQEETKYRYRKTTASKQTIDGIRSHYMCSQSGVYVYQGKGKRPAPERQIYKTGKACPAHMIVTETLERVLVTFYKTHVGHGVCPYYEPREPKKPKLQTMTNAMLLEEEFKAEVENQDEDDGEDGIKSESSLAWICDSCGTVFLDVDQFKLHMARHAPDLLPCHYCDNVFENIEAWTHHIEEHSSGVILNQF